MTFNPEFRRNLWVQITWPRLVAAPLVALILTYAFLAIFKQNYRLLESAAEMIGGVIIVSLWGTRRAADSLAEEVSGGTWEGQRMSGLGAWQMTWGKLIGSAGFVWYCAAIALIVVFWAGNRVAEAGGAIRPAGQVIFDFAVGGLMAHAAAFGIGLLLMRKAARYRSLTITLAQTCGVLLFIFIVRGGLIKGSLPHAAAPDLTDDPSWGVDPVTWYGFSIDPQVFRSAMIGIYCAWALIAAYRLMRNELQYRSLPWMWTLFLLFVAAWAAGFDLLPQFGLAARLAAPFLALAVLTYLSFFADSRDPVRYRWALAAVRSGDWKRALGDLPWWMISYLFTAAFALAIAWVLPSSVELSSDDGMGSVAIHAMRAASQHLAASLVLLMLFMLRDLFVLLWLSCSPWRSRADVTGIIYLAVVYWPLAAIFWVAGGLYTLPVVVPIATGNALVDYLPITIEVVFAAFLFYARWREITRLKPR